LAGREESAAGARSDGRIFAGEPGPVALPSTTRLLRLTIAPRLGYGSGGG